MLLPRRCQNCRKPPEYNEPNARAFVVENRMDALGDSLGADLLETIRPANISVLLRSGELPHCGRAVDREFADLLVASNWSTGFSDALHYRLAGRALLRKTLDRRHGIHV